MLITSALDQIGVTYEIVKVCGSEYAVTTQTGEVHFHYGTAAFAYDADAESDDDEIANYSDFCNAFTPVGPGDVNWHELAVALAVQGRRLVIAGACTPALTEAGFRGARMAAGL